MLLLTCVPIHINNSINSIIDTFLNNSNDISKRKN